MSKIKYETDQKTVQDIINLYEKGRLNLEPGFQRSSVWQENDRKKLIDSILQTTLCRQSSSTAASKTANMSMM